MKRLFFVLALVACSAAPKLPPAPKVTLPPPGDYKPSCDTIPTIRFMPNLYDYDSGIGTPRFPRFTVNTIVNPSLTGGTRHESLSG
jgi:hypothetical protein